jgi:hypothetical protein
MTGVKSRLLGQLLFICAAAGGIAPTATAADSAPLNATISFTETIVLPGTSCDGDGKIAGTGIAPRLGKVTLQSTDCVTGTVPGFTFASTQFRIIAANGDELRGTYGGAFTLDPVTGVGTIMGGFTITNGTGRLAHAKGGGFVTGTEQVDLRTFTGQGQLQLNGTISY